MFQKKVPTALQPHQAIVDYEYKLIPMYQENKVRFIFAKVDNYRKPYVVVVVALPIISPMNYPLETFLLLEELIRTYQINLDDVDVYLDFRERYGLKNGQFQQWFFTPYENTVKDTFGPSLEEDEVPLPLKLICDRYYKDRTLRE